METTKKTEQTMKHNFDLIPNHYRYQIINKNLVIHQIENFISINIELIEIIEETKCTIDINIKTDNICIWYSLYKDFPLIHCSIINLKN